MTATLEKNRMTWLLMFVQTTSICKIHRILDCKRAQEWVACLKLVLALAGSMHCSMSHTSARNIRIRFRRYWSNRFRSLASIKSEPYFTNVEPRLSVDKQKTEDSSYSLLGGRHSLSIKSLGVWPFIWNKKCGCLMKWRYNYLQNLSCLAELSTDLGDTSFVYVLYSNFVKVLFSLGVKSTKGLTDDPLATYSAWSCSCKVIFPELYTGSFLKIRGIRERTFASRGMLEQSTSENNISHTNLLPHVVSTLTMATSGCVQYLISKQCGCVSWYAYDVGAVALDASLHSIISFHAYVTQGQNFTVRCSLTISNTVQGPQAEIAHTHSGEWRFFRCTFFRYEIK